MADAQDRDRPAWLGYRSLAAWLRAVRPDRDPTDVRLGLALRDCHVLSGAVEERDVSLLAARKEIAAVTRCRPQVNRPDGLIDGQPGGEVVPAVVRNVVDLVCQQLRGVAEGDPQLLELVAETEQIVRASGSDVLQLEKALTLLARWVPPSSLGRRLDELVMAVLPSELEERNQRGLNDAALTLTSNGDGTRWRVRGQLSPECGERPHTALTAESTRNPRNPQDTAKAASLRSLALEPWDGVSGTGRPRSPAERLHDALDRLPERHLGANLYRDHGQGPSTDQRHDPRHHHRRPPWRAARRRGQQSPHCALDGPPMVVRQPRDGLRPQRWRKSRRHRPRPTHAHRSRATRPADRDRRHLRRSRVLPRETRPPESDETRSRTTFSDDGVTSLEDTVAIFDALHHDLQEAARRSAYVTAATSTNRAGNPVPRCTSSRPSELLGACLAKSNHGLLSRAHENGPV